MIDPKIRKALSKSTRIVSIEDTGTTRMGSPVVKVTCECATVVPGGLGICLCRIALSDPARYEEMVENHKAGRRLSAKAAK
jgi:hypothetical protein